MTHCPSGDPIQYVDTQSEIDRAVAAIAPCDALYFDTEFLREKTYHPLLCLAQINTGEEIFLVDPLSDNDYGQFWDALLGKRLVLHSGRQDLEVLKLASGRIPDAVFDTQIAAGLCGLPPQVGYANLVSEICNVDLAKAHTRTDWSRRPLAAAVLDYAADDVAYLPGIEKHLTDYLNSHHRSDWLEEDCQALLEPSLYSVDPEQAFRKLRGIARLPTEVQQRARALAGWRETIAINRNLPRQWVLRDEQLIGIAFENPQGKDAVAEIKGVHRKFADRHAAAVIDVLNQPLVDIEPPAERPDEAEKARLKNMAKAVKECALSIGIEAEILAPQRELKRAARGDTDLRALRGWRDTVVGDVIRAHLPG
ncbi:MAG: HRDC domain-containing protein [Pseudomonadota bacterium]